MFIIVNKFMSIFISVVCFFSGLLGTPDAKKTEALQFEIPGTGSCYAQEGRVSVHDPSIVQTKDGEFYAFGSHVTAAKSSDMISWQNVASGTLDGNTLLVPSGSTLRKELSEPLAWTDALQQIRGTEKENLQTNVWAADVIYNKKMGKYCYYASTSVWGEPHSVIWLATSDNIEGPYDYKSAVVYSGFDNLQAEKGYARTTPLHYSFTNIGSLLDKGKLYIKDVFNNTWCYINGTYNHEVYPNAIDPAVFYDKDGQLWMTYGSYFGGIYIMPLEEKTGLPDYKYMRQTDGYDIYFGKRISISNDMNGRSGEGPYIIYDSVSDYYYLYISVGGLDTLGGYNIRQYRSKTPDGAYTDIMGNNALDNVNSGVKLFGNYSFSCLENAYLSGGHSSTLITNDGRMFICYHTRFENQSEGFQLRVHQLARTKNGWTVALPFEYSGEIIDKNELSENEIVGEYEFIKHGTETVRAQNAQSVSDTVSKTYIISLNEDGTITCKDTKLQGTWQALSGTAYGEFVIDGITYEGVFTKQKQEGASKTIRTVFSAVGENNECIWGVSTF